MANNSSNPLVSIIIPTYNRAGYLREALSSVVAQTYPSIEIIVVDDGSSDNTAQVIEEFNQPICLIKQRNLGVSAARNRGLAESHGELVCFLDDDDTYLPEKIEKQVRKFNTQPELGFVHTRYQTTDPYGKVFERAGLLQEGDPLPDFLSGNTIWMSSPMIRRSILEQVGGFDSGLSTAADYDLWLRILERGYRLGCVQEILGCYRIHPISMVTRIDLLEQEVIAILDRFYQREFAREKYLSYRDEAYAKWRIWICTRYYGTGGFENGRRNLLEAIRLNPKLGEHDWLIYYFAGNSIDPRVADPFQYAQDLFANLPEPVAGLGEKKHLMLSYIHMVEGLRAYARGETDLACQSLARAVQADPQLIRKPRLFSFVLCGLAMSQPVLPLDYLNRVYSHLPGCVEELAATRSRVIGRVRIGMAFEDYHLQQYRSALTHSVPEILRHPAWVVNRGVQSMVAKSMIGLVKSRAERKRS